MKLLAFALGSLWRRRARHAAVLGIFALLLAALSSVLLVAGALEQALLDTVAQLPDLSLQRLQGGRQRDIPLERALALVDLPGVESVQARVWGYHYFSPAATTFTLLGVDALGPIHRESLAELVEGPAEEGLIQGNAVVVGPAVQRAVDSAYARDGKLLIPDAKGKVRELDIAGVFHDATALFSGDLVLMDESLARDLLGVAEDEASDLLLHLSQAEELPNLMRKIQARYPDMRMVTREQLAASYAQAFDLQSGVFLAVFLAGLLAFFVLVFERASSMSAEERRELALLRALGWSMSQLLRMKFMEQLLLIFVGMTLGLGLSLAYVFLLDAPGLLALFAGHSALRPEVALPMRLDLWSLLAMVFSAGAVTLAASLIPSHRAVSAELDGWLP